MSQVTFITGASSGIGAGLARRFARAGAPVALAARRRERLEALAQGIRGAGGTALALPCDVTVQAAVREAVSACEEKLGPVGRLIVNAGVNRPNRATDFHADDVEAVFRVNVFGAANCFEAVLPGMVERGAGQVVGISSLGSFNPLPGFLAYSASKSALSNLLEGLRMELRDAGITVTTIYPGFIKTEMTEDYDYPMPFLMEQEDAVARIYASIRRGVAEDAFPRPLALLARGARLLPRPLFDWVGRRFFAGQL